MIVQKLLIDAVVKAIGKKKIKEQIERLFNIQQNHDDRIKKLEDYQIKNRNNE